MLLVKMSTKRICDGNINVDCASYDENIIHLKSCKDITMANDKNDKNDKVSQIFKLLSSAGSIFIDNRTHTQQWQIHECVIQQNENNKQDNTGK